MTVKNKVKLALVVALFLIGAGGLIVHLWVHSPDKGAYGLVPLTAGILSVGLVPWLFLYRRTLNFAYLVNGFTVILGTVTMGHYALTREPIWLDLLFLWPKLLLGFAFYQLEVFNPDSAPKLGFNTIRYPHFGFWLVHLVGFTTVYALGALLWR